jgi:hypothetical protein
MNPETEISAPVIREDLTLVTAPDASAIPWIWMVVGMLALVALLLPLYLAFRPKRVVPDIETTPPAPDPAIEARERLRALRKQLPVLPVREVAIECSAILRDYVSGRFNIRAPYQTSAEFLKQMQSTDGFPADDVESVSDVLMACDTFKFAGGMLAQGTLDPLLDEVEELINHTTPVDAPEPKAVAHA